MPNWLIRQSHLLALDSNNCFFFFCSLLLLLLQITYIKTEWLSIRHEITAAIVECETHNCKYGATVYLIYVNDRCVLFCTTTEFNKIRMKNTHDLSCPAENHSDKVDKVWWSSIRLMIMEQQHWVPYSIWSKYKQIACEKITNWRYPVHKSPRTCTMFDCLGGNKPAFYPLVFLNASQNRNANWIYLTFQLDSGANISPIIIIIIIIFRIIHNANNQFNHSTHWTIRILVYGATFHCD